MSFVLGVIRTLDGRILTRPTPISNTKFRFVLFVLFFLLQIGKFCVEKALLSREKRTPPPEPVVS
jgi:hypothetical protein